MRLRGLRGGTAVAGVTALVFVHAIAPFASAHDPGQGADAGSVALTVVAHDLRVRLKARVPDANCSATEPVAVVARRAGRTVRAPLRANGCDLSGAVEVPERGRWFVYAQMRRNGRAVESWLPVTVREGGRERVTEERYAYVPNETVAGTGQVVAAALLYAAMLGLLWATLALVRSACRSTTSLMGWSRR